MLADKDKRRPKEKSEWIPPWLRITRTLPLALYCVAFALLLEALDFVIRQRHGLAADSKHTSSVDAARYIPTVGIVALGFACKSVASDAKKVTPWSAISRRWAKSSNSITLDYVNSNEVFSVVPAARRRHWAVLTGLMVGFVCGSLVAVANSLTHVDLLASSTQPATFNKATTFDFDETLETANHSLAIAYTSEGQQPYAAVVAEQLPNGQAAAWTMDSYVFESFTNTSQLPENGTIEAQTTALFPGWSCHPIDLTVNDTDLTLIFSSKTSAQPELNCSRDVQMAFYGGSDSNDVIRGWLNVTACDEDETDLRLVSTLLRRTNATKADDEDTSFNTTMVSALCAPSFTTQDAVVRVNQSTGEVLDYSLGSSTPTPIDIQTTMMAMYIYLNNPLDGRSQVAFATNDIGFTTNTKPQANLSVVTEAAYQLLRQYKIDPFMSSITDDQAALNINSFLGDAEKLATAVEGQANSIMAQMINSLARADATGSMDGRIRVDGPKLFLRQISLRALQAFLLVIAVACVCQSTLIRPKSILREDPGSIAAQAVVLASSSKAIEQVFVREAVSSEKHMRHALSGKLWSLQPSPNGAVMLQAAKQEHQDSLHPVPSSSAGAHNHDGFRPLALRVWAKWGVIAATVVVMAALAALMAVSRLHDGICANTPAASDAFAFAPTVVFLVLGYAASGMDSAIRLMAPYRSLWSGYSGKKQPLLFSFSDAPSVLAPFRAIKNRLGLTVAASSFVILFIPAIKIVAAGLYNVQLVQRTAPVAPLVDLSFVDHLENTFGLVTDTAAEGYSVYDEMATGVGLDLDANVQTAAQFTEWTLYPDFAIPVQAGILDNLVFSNVTSMGELLSVSNSSSDIDLSAATITLTVPAIAVNVSCHAADLGISAYRENCTNGEPYFDFYGHCETAACNATMNVMADSSYGTYFSFKSDFGSQAPCSSRANRYHGSTSLRYDLGYEILLGDLGDAQGYVANTSEFGNVTRPVTADLFNISSLPTVLAAVCYSNFSRVDVSTTFSRKSSSSSSSTNSNSSSTTTSWHPISYAPASLRTVSALPNAPWWLAPPAATKAWDHFNQYDSSTDTPGLLDSGSLWPTRGSSTSFFELLAAWASTSTSTSNNVTRLMDSPVLLAAAAAVYQRYATNMLTQLRPWAQNASAYSPPTSFDNATLAYAQQRIAQDLPSTIALEACLALLAICFGWAAARFPSAAVLPKSPGSVAAGASLVAGSALLERLRAGEVASVRGAREGGMLGDENGEKGKAQGTAALGWWRESGKGEGLEESESEGDGDGEALANNDELDEADIGEKSQMRWGIDVGVGVIRQSWRELPERGNNAEQTPTEQ